VVVPIVAAFAAQFLTAKAQQSKATAKSEIAGRYITEAAEAVSTAILYTAQTYTDTLKKSGTFTVENQKTALYRTLDQAKSLLTERMRCVSLSPPMGTPQRILLT
jgi:hypothetical protein